MRDKSHKISKTFYRLCWASNQRGVELEAREHAMKGGARLGGRVYRETYVLVRRELLEDFAHASPSPAPANVPAPPTPNFLSMADLILADLDPADADADGYIDLDQPKYAHLVEGILKSEETP